MDRAAAGRARTLVAAARAAAGCPGGATQLADWTPAELADIAAALTGDADWTCQLFLMTAISAYSQGDVATARAHLDRCRAVAEVGARHHLPEVIATGAVLDAADGRPGAALAAVQQVLARVGANATAVDLVGVLPKAALALLDADRPGEALALLTRSATEGQARFGIRPTGTIAVNAGWAALAVGDPQVALGWFGQALVGPHAFVVPAALGEAAVGAGTARAALPDADSPEGGSEVAELLGLGQWLLDEAGYVLPPSLAKPVAAAVARTGSASPPPGWTEDDAVARIAARRRSGRRPSASRPTVTGWRNTGPSAGGRSTRSDRRPSGRWPSTTSPSPGTTGRTAPRSSTPTVSGRRSAGSRSRTGCTPATTSTSTSAWPAKVRGTWPSAAG